MKFAGSLPLTDSEKAIYEIIGVPFDDNATIRGASKAPEMIRRASQRLETFMWHNKLELSDLLYYDRGDLHDITDPDLDLDFDAGKRKIFIGGDHSISYPLFRYYFERLGLTKVVVIDAHADFRDVYVGNRFSNACVMRRIAELAGFENVIEIGVRSASWEEYEFMKKRVRILNVDDMPEEQELEGRLYLSIDIDVLDPGIAPGVEYPEPCGISLEALIRLVRTIIKRGDVVACDIVEVNPELDIKNGITCLNAARLVFEVLASYWLKDHKSS